MLKTNLRKNAQICLDRFNTRDGERFIREYSKRYVKGQAMTITTRDFGQMELDEGQLLDFRSPIFGFDNLRRYALLSDEETGAGLMWLQSVEQPDTCFILLDPEEIGLDYKPEIPADAKELLALTSVPAIRLIAVVPAEFRQTTVNLKSPILINTEKKWAAQVILDEDYPIRMALFGAEEG